MTTTLKLLNARKTDKSLDKEAEIKKMFTTTQNFELLREKLGEYKRTPTEKETREFLIFFDDVYKLWKAANPSLNLDSIEKKAKARREFVHKLGISL